MAAAEEREAVTVIASAKRVAETDQAPTPGIRGKLAKRALKKIKSGVAAKDSFVNFGQFRKSRDNNQRRGNEGLKVEKRDKSKVIAKESGPKGQKKISLQQLRREDNNGGKKGPNMNKKGGDRGDDKKGDRRGRKDLGRRGDKKGGRHGKKGGKPHTKDPKLSMEDLDKEMESYWVKGGHTEVGK